MVDIKPVRILPWLQRLREDDVNHDKNQVANVGNKDTQLKDVKSCLPVRMINLPKSTYMYIYS